jgi:hypothetical protein
MFRIISIGYFIRDLVVLLISLAIIGVLTSANWRIKKNLGFPYFVTAFYSMIGAFILVAVAEFIGILMRTSLEYGNTLLLDVRSIILTLGALFLLASSVAFYIPFCKDRYMIIKVAAEPRGTNKYGAYWGSRKEVYAKFQELTKKEGIPSLAVTRDPPEVFREKLGLTVTPVIWVSKVPSEDAVEPTRLPYLLEKLKAFLQSADIDKVILMDCVEYLMIENGDQAVFKFLTNLKDLALLNRGILLVPVDKNALDEKTLGLLTSELSPISLLEQRERGIKE